MYDVRDKMMYVTLVFNSTQRNVDVLHDKHGIEEALKERSKFSECVDEVDG